jgi:hypothetical protein
MKKLVGYAMLGGIFRENQKTEIKKQCPKCKKDGLIPLNDNGAYGCYLCGYNSDEG